MFVGGLNWDTTDGTVPCLSRVAHRVNFVSLLSPFWLPSDGLRNYFSQFGKVDACTIMRDPAGRSRGFAFLTFEDPAAVNAVMVREHYLDGKIVSIPYHVPTYCPPSLPYVQRALLTPLVSIDRSQTRYPSGRAPTGRQDVRRRTCTFCHDRTPSRVLLSVRYSHRCDCHGRPRFESEQGLRFRNVRRSVWR
jgi:RNA recognition motif-containing protein